MLVTWIRVNVQSALTLGWAGINAVEIDQRTTYQNVIAGVSDGSANQQFALAQTQIDPGTFQLDVDMPGLGFQLWTAVDDLAVLQGPVPAFVLDPEAGTVSFGNQMQGMIPPIGRRVRARLMRAGGGAAGNLPAGTLTAIQATGCFRQRCLRAHGAAADRHHAAARILKRSIRPSSVSRPRCAIRSARSRRTITRTSCRRCRAAASARVEVLPLFKPQTRDTNVPGVVSVMVIPPKANFQPPCPRADRTLLENVYAYLNPQAPGGGRDVRHRDRVRRSRTERRGGSAKRLRPAAGQPAGGAGFAQLPVAGTRRAAPPIKDGRSAAPCGASSSK